MKMEDVHLGVDIVNVKWRGVRASGWGALHVIQSRLQCTCEYSYHADAHRDL